MIAKRKAMFERSLGRPGAEIGGALGVTGVTAVGPAGRARRGLC